MLLLFLRRGRRRRPDTVVGAENGDALWRSARDWRRAHPPQHAWESAFDGTRLHGEVYDRQRKHWVIVVHGYTSNAEEMTLYVRTFLERGYNVLAPDNRGHGESGGHYIGMGWHDRLDVQTWITHILKRAPEADIILFGVSMGAATVMMAAGTQLPSNVKAVIEDCGYTSAYEEFRYQLGRFHLPPFPLIAFTSLFCRLFAGYWIGDASAVRQVSKTQLPVLFIHGAEDAFVPACMMHTLYHATSSRKACMLVPGAAHTLSVKYAGQMYWEKIWMFLEDVAG